jgi:exoribonuclease R
VGSSLTIRPAAVAQVQQLSDRSVPKTDRRDLRHLLWCSIDNEDSRDLDQLSVAEARGSDTAILVAIADVDAMVPCDSAVDRHAQTNTTSVYTPAEVFPMLPERLSTDLTSLVEGVDRSAVVVEMTISKDGTIGESSIYQATVRNRAKLAYPSVGAWLEGDAPPPAAALCCGRTGRQSAPSGGRCARAEGVPSSSRRVDARDESKVGRSSMETTFVMWPRSAARARPS